MKASPKFAWKKYLMWLVHPMAIGFYITIVMVKLTFHYYEIAGRSHDTSHEQGVASLLYMAHQKSIDYRLRARGPRPVSRNIALLAADERSITALGRWPWGRNVMAKALDNAFLGGAKLIAFDIAFSEPQLNPAEQVTEDLKTSGHLSGDLAQALEASTNRLDFDKALGETFAKHADKIVAGSFFTENVTPTWPPETEFCHDMVFKLTPAAKQWDKEEILLSVNDPYQPYLPKALRETFQAVLQEKEKAIREKLGTPKNKSEQISQDSQIQQELHATCDTILEDFREGLNEQWQGAILAQENQKEFNFPSYDAWLDAFRARSKSNSVQYADGWVLNTDKIAQGTKHTAYFNTEQDSDGTIRSKALIVRTGNTYFPSLSLKAFLVAHGYNATPKLEVNPATGSKEIVDLEVTDNETGNAVMHIPTDHQGKLLINYAGPDRMFPYISFADLLSDSPDAEIEQRLWVPETRKWETKLTKVKKAQFLKDKILIAGATATGIYDLRVTPFQENFPGTETHLNALDNMEQRGFFRTLPDEKIYMPIVLAVLGLSLSIALSYLGALWSIGLTGVSLVGVILYDKNFLFTKGIVVSIIWPIFLICALYVVLTFYRYLTEERGKKELRQTFQKYVSPAIVEEILAHPANIELGGRKANLTVSFSDVRGFTTISEKLDPKALSDLLNSYLTPMTEIVFKNQGTLDKYMGDAIMAFFGAPIAYQDHAKWACRCALQSLTKLKELQDEYAKKGLPTIDIGIGLNTGEVNVGNMGSQTVRSYTVMGDAVNLASRLEGINKTYGTRVILSEFTYKEVKDNFVCREVDWVRVKGKAQPVKIYELIAEEKVPQQTVELLKWFQEGYNHYHNKAWKDAISAFEKAVAINPNDEVSKLYIERCSEYYQIPPDDGWDGVFVMKSK
jgi:adenylate cyclase